MTSKQASNSDACRVGMAFVSIYSLAYFGVWMALLTPAVVTLALKVAQIDPASKEANLALIMGLGAIVAMLTNPIAGLLSDRTTSGMGMRRPWLIGGMALGIAGLYMVATGGLASVLIGWCIAQLGFNAVLAAIIAVFPDQVSENQRGKVSGVLGICLQLGIVAGVSLTQAMGESMFWMFMLPGFISAFLVLMLVFALKDRRIDSTQLKPLDMIGFAKSFWIDPRKAPDFAWAFVSRFFLFIGLASLLTYQVFYLIDQLHIEPNGIPAAMLTSTLVTTAATVLGSLFSGWLSDRLKRQKIFVLLAAVIYGVGLLVISLANDFDAFLWGIAICGIGQGVYLAVDLVLVTLVLPNKDTDAAKDLGIFNLASALPQSIAPAIAPILLSIGSTGHNYVALFIAAAIFSTLGALAIIPIKGVR